MLAHCSRSFTIKFMMLPYSFTNRCVNALYRRSSEGLR